MRIAVATNNGKTLASHGGRCRFFAIYQVDEKKRITKIGGRPNPHLEFVRERHSGGYGTGRGMGHGGGGHDMVYQAIHGCDVLLAGGMGPRLAGDLAARGIKPVVTEERDITRALCLFLEGKLDEGGFCKEKEPAKGD